MSEVPRPHLGCTPRFVSVNLPSNCASAVGCGALLAPWLPPEFRFGRSEPRSHFSRLALRPFTRCWSLCSLRYAEACLPLVNCTRAVGCIGFQLPTSRPRITGHGAPGQFLCAHDTGPFALYGPAARPGYLPRCLRGLQSEAWFSLASLSFCGAPLPWSPAPPPPLLSEHLHHLLLLRPSSCL
jgi:hypothetical protein